MMLWLNPTQAETLVALARAGAPREVCGVLLGSVSGEVTDTVPIANLATAPERTFRMDERALARALTSLPASGLELLAFYHSHPANDPRPSALDIAQAAYPDVAMVIIGLHPSPALTAWTVRYGEVTPIEIVISTAPPQAQGFVWTRAAQIAVLIAIIGAVALFMLIAFSLLPPAPQIPPTPIPR
ncbi:MAG TPA: M67 family metallopeptidase [Candidatus Limnocylindrales bacterium]|nr:M67 family metallopeptidase [Candidatus Limnocylindrales bacterium]